MTALLSSYGPTLDAMERGENSPDNTVHNATDRPAFVLVSTTLKGSAPPRCRANRNGCNPAGTRI
jgi:hypothetical protein